MAFDIKTLPRWSYYASAAAVAAVLGYKVWEARGGGATTETTPSDTTADGSTNDGTTYTSTSGVVPIFTSGSQATDSADDGSSSVGDAISGAFQLATSALDSATTTTSVIGDAFSNLSTTSTGFVQQELQSQRDNNAAILSIMQAGESPASVQTAPVINYNVTPAAAPVSVAANSAAAPPAPAGFPLQNKATGQWYKITTASSAGKDSSGTSYKKGATLHVYQDGHTLIA